MGVVDTRNYVTKKEFQTFLRVGWYQYALEKTMIEFLFRLHFLEIAGTTLLYTLFLNGRQFSILLFTCKLAFPDSFKGKCSFEVRTRPRKGANSQVNKTILKWRLFWNKVYGYRKTDLTAEGKKKVITFLDT